MKRCEKCLKTYDDTWDVCLMCGDELKRVEACKSVCENEGKDPRETVLKADIEKKLVLLICVVTMLLIIYYIYYFVTEIYVNAVERIFT